MTENTNNYVLVSMGEFKEAFKNKKIPQVLNQMLRLIKNITHQLLNDWFCITIKCWNYSFIKCINVHFI